MELPTDLSSPPVPLPARSQPAAAPAHMAVRLPGCEVRVELHDRFDTVQVDWLALQRQGAAHPYQHLGWLRHWHAHIGAPAGARPCIIVVRDAGGAARMLLPLARRSRGSGPGARCLAFMGMPVIDYQAPLLDAGFAARLDAPGFLRLVDAALALARADALLVTHVPPRVGDQPNPLLALATRPFIAQAHRARLGTDWPTYFHERRSASTRRRLREKEAALARSGALSFQVCADPAQRLAAVQRLVRLKSAQLQATTGAFNTFERPGVQPFFAALAADPQADGIVAFELRAGELLVASALGIVRGDCFYYQVAVHPEPSLRRHSPGSLLLMRMIAWAMERGCTCFDFTVGDEPYKADWCDEAWTLHYGARCRNLRGRLAAALMGAAVQARGWLKRHPALYRWVVRLRG